MELKMYVEKIRSLKMDCDIFLKENKLHRAFISAE